MTNLEQTRILLSKCYKFFIAIINADKDVLEILYEKAIDRIMSDRYGKPALQIALSNDNPRKEIIELLLNKGADPNRKNSYDGWTTLHFAIHKNVSVDIIQLLLAKTADPNIREDQLGKTSLHLACYNRNININIIKLLVETGADIHSGDSWNGETPVHVAAELSCSDALIIFLAYNTIDLNIANYFGLTPKQIVFKKKNAECMALVEEYERRRTVWTKSRHWLFPTSFKQGSKIFLMINTFVLEQRKIKLPKPIFEIIISQVSKNVCAYKRNKEWQEIDRSSKKQKK